MLKTWFFKANLSLWQKVWLFSLPSYFKFKLWEFQFSHFYFFIFLFSMSNIKYIPVFEKMILRYILASALVAKWSLYMNLATGARYICFLWIGGYFVNFFVLWQASQQSRISDHPCLTLIKVKTKSKFVIKSRPFHYIYIY